MGDPAYEHTISGLIRKRGEMMAELSDLRERMAITTHDIEGLDRILERMGYDGDIPLTPRAARVVLFYRNELRHWLKGELTAINGPVSTRDLAVRLMAAEGKDARDRRMMSDITRRMGRALRQMRDHGIVAGKKERNEYNWIIANDRS